jgi:hypothetical protein
LVNVGYVVPKIWPVLTFLASAHIGKGVKSFSEVETYIRQIS